MSDELLASQITQCENKYVEKRENRHLSLEAFI
jgi:hypothetical protein